MQAKSRLEELDSLRGIAALTVLSQHLLFSVVEVPNIVDYSPLHVLWAGHEAVIFFFVLSGFVLALPFVDGRRFDFGPYAIKRVFRIWLPYVVATAAALLLATVTVERTEVSAWVARKWQDPPSLRVWIDHVLLVGNYQTVDYNPVLWSLVHELRISLIFPLILWAVRKFDWKVCVAIALSGSLIDAVNLHFGLEPSIGWRSSFLESLHFATMFMAGALLARHRQFAVEWFHRRSRTERIGLWVLAFLGYVYGRAALIVPSEAMRTVHDVAITLGVIVVIQTALASKRFARALQHPWLVICGRTSYSLYLWHVVVLLVVFHLLGDELAMVWLVALTLIGSVLATTASYVLVEKPSITLAKRAAAFIASRSSRSSPSS
jgi:peptidoglycan/LPS O-acetylase OafA/YrhL